MPENRGTGARSPNWRGRSPRGASRGESDEPASPELASLVRRQLELLGEDPDREGLERTPERVAKSLAYLTRGYAQRLEDVVGKGVFAADGHRNMIMVRDIEMYSLCEHHLLPFFFKLHLPYIPNKPLPCPATTARITHI